MTDPDYSHTPLHSPTNTPAVRTMADALDGWNEADRRRVEAEAERDELRAALTEKTGHYEAAERQIDRMRPVVAAACDLDGVVLMPFEDYDSRKIEDQSRRSAAFENAVDAYRAALNHDQEHHNG